MHKNQDFSQTVNPENIAWYYEKNGERLGPIQQSEIIELIDNRTLFSDSVVWSKGMNEWKPLNKTNLNQYLNQDVPPPLTGQHVNNTMIWFLAFAPILGMLLEYFVAGALSGGDIALAEYEVNEGYYFLITIALNIVLSIVDENKLAKAGINTQKFKGVVWLVPVYLFQRAKALDHSLSYFIVWIVCFILVNFV